MLEGGYSDRALISGVMSHLCGLASKSSEADDVMNEDTIRYNPEWWSKDSLDTLERIAYPSKFAATKPSRRQAVQTNYSSPTESHIAKINDAVSTRRISSGISPYQDNAISVERPLTSGSEVPYLVSRAEAVVVHPDHIADFTQSTPPAVDWTIATTELARLLIPVDQPTTSFTFKELQAAKSRLQLKKRSRMKPIRDISAVNSPETDASRRTSTRVRKPTSASSVANTPSRDNPATKPSSSPIRRGRGRPPKIHDEKAIKLSPSSKREDPLNKPIVTKLDKVS